VCEIEGVCTHRTCTFFCLAVDGPYNLRANIKTPSVREIEGVFAHRIFTFFCLAVAGP